MKTTQILYTIILCLLLSAYAIGQTTTNNKKSPFLITVENTTQDEIKLTCAQGCAWESLAFSLTENNNMRIINPLGIAGLTDYDTIADPNTDFADFLIYIKKSGNSIQLKGLKGTDWIDLNFILNKNKRAQIDKTGATI